MAKLKKNQEVAAYGLDPLFERIVAEMASARPSFFARVGFDLDPERIGDPTSRMVLEACRAIAAEGKPPSAPVIVVQRLQSWHQRGQVSADDLEAARELLQDAVEDAGAFDEDAVIAELAPVVRRIVERDAIDSMLQSHAKRRDLTQAEQLLARAKRIGASNVSTGSRLTRATVQEVVRRTQIVRQPTGIIELDAEIGGGLKRGTYTVVTGSTGTGKSMFIDRFVCNAIISCIPSAIATLELGEEDHHSRIIGDLTDLPYEDILRYPDVAREAEERMAALEDDGLLSFCTIRYFTPRATTVSDLDRWIQMEEEVHRVKIQAVGVDYGQLLCGEKAKARHEEMTDVAEDLRKWAKSRNMWLVVPNQANAEGMNAAKTKVLENHHSADSKGIPKTADLHITLNPRDDGESVLYHIAKNRYGPTNGNVGPLPHEFEKGRIAPAIREGWPF